MAAVKVVSRSACTAFAPSTPYIAAGTMAGAVDLSFSSSANIDIYQLDFASDDRQMILAGSASSSERFNRLSWGKELPDSEEFAMGLIAGGMLDGNIGLWNPKQLISAQANAQAADSGFICNLSKHKGPVRGLEFNAHSPNRLASGADEGDIYIWDVTKPAEPSHFPPLKASGSGTQGEVSFLSWNSKHLDIFASTSYNGVTVIWDIKRQKPAISFSDSDRKRSSVLQWNPDLATQLIVASDEDSSPSLKLWDLRNSMSPVREFVGHTKGVIAMSWCPIDSSYLLTCAKDNRTFCWDLVSGEVVTELPAGNNWNFDIHWYPRIPGVISASSFDGKVGIYNIEGCDRYGIGEGDFGTARLRAPKWYKRKAGVSFGFGGKLVSFSSVDGPTGSSEVLVRNLVTEQTLLNRSSEFEAAIHNGERDSLRFFCEKKSQESVSEDERETWGFLKVLFEEKDARSTLVSHLGFNPPSALNDTPDANISEQVSTLDLNTNDGKEDGYARESLMFATDNGEDFFNNLPSPKADTPIASGNKVSIDDSVPGEESQEEPKSQEDSVDTSFDDSVQRALVVGDYKGAVTQCIAANKMADALVIAHVGGDSLWENTRSQYLKTSRSPYLQVLAATLNNDMISLVNTRPLKSWKETIALLCTFATPEQWTLLCDTLASKLMASGNTLAASLCYICSTNIDRAVEIWSRSLANKHDGKSFVDHLQDLMEKTIVLALATGQKKFSSGLCKLVEKYAEILASQGLLTTAMEYLKLMGTQELSPELAVLQNRIALSIESENAIDKVSAVEDFQRQPAPTYPVDPYHQSIAARDTVPTQPHPSVPNSPYSENNQQTPFAPYRPEINVTAPYRPEINVQGPYRQEINVQGPYRPEINVPYQSYPQPSIMQPNFFVPPQQPTVGPGTLVAPAGANQQPIKSFVPSNTPMLKNIEQYQQQTLHSQLYQGASNPPYQTIPGPTLQNTVPAGPPPGLVPRGYPSATINPGVQRPIMNPIQPPNPAQVTPVQPSVSPPAPLPTVETADTSNVPAHQKPVIATLTRLFKETSEALGGGRNPAKKREIDDNSKKLGSLFVKLNTGDISKNAAEKLLQLCQALDSGNYTAALDIQVSLTTTDWDECNFWLSPLKRMIKTRMQSR